MNRRHYYLISIILVAVIVMGLVFLDSASIQPKSTPKLLYSSSISDQDTGVVFYTLNASQGTTLRVNLTLSSVTSATIAVPVSLTMTSYTSNTNIGNISLSQQSVFNYSISLNPLTLQPQTSNSTTITINFAKDAPIGRCYLDINLGSLKFLSNQGKYDLPYGSSIPLEIMITPKAM